MEWFSKNQLFAGNKSSTAIQAVELFKVVRVVRGALHEVLTKSDGGCSDFGGQVQVEGLCVGDPGMVLVFVT